MDRDLFGVTTTVLIHRYMGNGNFSEYLLTKRAPHKFMGEKWCIPGGGLERKDYIHLPTSEPGVTQWYSAVDISMVREIKEEVGVEIGRPIYYDNVVFVRPSDGIHMVNFMFYAPYQRGEVVLDEDATEFAWVITADLDSYNLIPGLAKEIRKVDRILQGEIRRDMQDLYALE